MFCFRMVYFEGHFMLDVAAIGVQKTGVSTELGVSGNTKQLPQQYQCNRPSYMVKEWEVGMK